MAQDINFLKNDFVASDARKYSAINLAYMGDAVFEILVRNRIFLEAKTTNKSLHNLAKDIVNAGRQAKMFDKIMPILSEEETLAIIRGRNAKTNSKAKNSTLKEYRKATGLESLFGYLYIKGEFERIKELFEICISE